MRAALGFAALQLVFVTAGIAFLYALGMISRPREIPARIGPAYLCGVAAVTSVLIFLLVIGVPARLPALGAVAGALAVGFAALGLVRARRGRPGPTRTPAPTGRVEALLSRAAVLALALYFAIGATAFAKLPTDGDDWAFWSYKGLGLYEFGGRLNPEMFLNGGIHPPHLDYPVLQPLLESLTFRAMGGVHLQEWHISLWILFAAFVWTVAFLLRSRGVGMLLLLAPLGALALSPYAAFITSIGYADVTVACFVAAGALAVGLWLDSGRAEYALFGAVLLAGAANAKNEGQTAAAVVLVAAAAVLLIGRDRRWRQWLAASAVVAAAAAPWIAWRSVHGLGSDDLPPLLDSLDVGFLAGRLDRLGSAVGKLFQQLALQDRWIWIVPCFLTLAIACIVTATARRQATFYLATAALMLFTLYWAYWTGKPAIDRWLGHSANRVVTVLVFTCGVGTVHLVAKLLAGEERAPP